jgi:dipeptidyl aminopeptidase/acylaminoacyl peptidase
MTTRRELIAGAALSALTVGIFGTRALAQTPPSPAAKPLDPFDFHLIPTTVSSSLSPSGKRVAVLRNKYTAQGVVSWLDIIDAENPTAPAKVVPLGEHGASGAVWANETRLLIWVVYNVTHKGFETEEIARVVALNDDGTAPAVMFGNRGTSLEYIHDLGRVIDELPDDPDHVLMAAPEPTRGLMALYKVDINTGDAVVVEYGAPRTYNWLTQDGVARIRFDDDRGAGSRIMARAPGESDWKFVHQYRVDQIPDFAIYGPSDKPGVFLASARVGDEDKTSVREVDLATLKLGAPSKVDVGGVWLDRRRKLMATTWQEDRQAYAFTDKGFAAHFAAIEKYFGPEQSLTLHDADDARTRYLGIASGPRDPGTYFMYDRKSHAVTELGPYQSHLTPQRLGAMHILAVKTRDGSDVRAYLTAPPSGVPGPLVVMPHGGPESRDYWGYDTWSQVLAAQGWWVLRPNFRGSGGYGLDFAKQGWRRWGERMQEDVEDATAQAIADFKLDRSKVAIFGGSYGGYGGPSSIRRWCRWMASATSSSN